MKEKVENTKGITLIALVVTIVVLLILAGISIGAITGDNGIIDQAHNAKEDTERSQWEEQIDVAIIDAESKNRNPNMDDVIDELINKEVIDKEEQVNKKTGTITTNEPSYIIEGKLDDYLIKLEADTGKEALILVYNVSAGDAIELPYYLKWYDGENENPATFDFTVDWGDGSTDSITNSDIATKSIHQYTTAGERRITITGTFESIASYNESYEGRQGYDKLIRVEQWGVTGLKTIYLTGLNNLTQLATPTESSFKDLTAVMFAASGIQKIPDKMFFNCTKLTIFENTFYDCTNLQTIGDYAFSGCSSVESFGNAFNGCTNLQTIGDYAFENCTSITSFENVFEDCTNLQTIGDYVFSGCTKVESFDFMFYLYYKNLTTIGDGVFANCSNAKSFNNCFSYCENLTTIGDGVFANCSNVKSFNNCFRHCYNLTTIGENIFEGCTNVEDYGHTFSGCGKISGKAPELWLLGTNSEENDYQGNPDGLNCFAGCRSLDNYDEIPDYWKNVPE